MDPRYCLQKIYMSTRYRIIKPAHTASKPLFTCSTPFWINKYVSNGFFIHPFLHIFRWTWLLTNLVGLQHVNFWYSGFDFRNILGASPMENKFTFPPHCSDWECGVTTKSSHEMVQFSWVIMPTTRHQVSRIWTQSSQEGSPKDSHTSLPRIQAGITT